MTSKTDHHFTSSQPIYEVTAQDRETGPHPGFDGCYYLLKVGNLLPTLPIWVTEDRTVWLDLEASYEETCRALRIA
jgi:hypothetical protein